MSEQLEELLKAVDALLESGAVSGDHFTSTRHSSEACFPPPIGFAACHIV